MVKLTPNFPVRGVPGGWRDEWSAPDDAAIARARFASWAARAGDSAVSLTRPARTALSPASARPSENGHAADIDRHILVGVSQPTDDPSQHRSFTLRARFDAAADGWVAQLGEQNRNDQIDGWEPAAGVTAASLAFPTAAACLGAAVARLIELVDRDAADPASAR